MTLDHKEFDSEMQAQKERARAAAAVEATDWVVLRPGEQEFVGYDLTACPAEILRYRKVKQKGREYYQIVLSQTPFYGEMGGQVGDRGYLSDDITGEKTEIYDTKRENGMSVHLAAKLPENPQAQFTAAIDVEARRATECNHTATHLLHLALRQVLGTHVEQKGSFVSPDILRFDFSHFQKVTPEEIRKVEHLANSIVRKAIPLDEHRSVPIEAAREMGAMALFGEKYGEEVRVIRYGDSIELCGGTHVPNTGCIGMIRIVSEGSTAAGIRRIEAQTGAAVERTLDTLQDTLADIARMFNNAPDLIGALRKAIDENAELRKEAEEVARQKLEEKAAKMVAGAKIINGVQVVEFRGLMKPEIVKNLAFAVRRLSADHTAFVAATKDTNEKPLLTVMLSEDLVKSGLNASVMVREAAKSIKGGGGGQPGFAQAGGKDSEGLGAAADALMANFK